MRTRQIKGAFNQLQTYQASDPLAVRLQRGCSSCRTASRRGSGTHRGRTRVVQALAHDRTATRWRAVVTPELQVVVEGVFDRRRFLDLVRHFVVFEDLGGAGPGQEDGGLPPVPRRERRGGGDAPRRAPVPTRHRKTSADTRPDASPGASPATGAWASSGTPKGRARA